MFRGTPDTRAGWRLSYIDDNADVCRKVRPTNRRPKVNTN